MSSLANQEYIHVVVGIVKNARHEILVSQRKADTHLGGLLEFPGGKVEKHESPTDALHRELFEELNINASSFTPLIQIPYNYPSKKVLLDAFLVNDYSGKAISKEEQNIFWKPIDSLYDNIFPAANFGMIRAIKLPNKFLVTPSYSNDSKFLEKFESIISKKSIQIIQLRSHELADQEYRRLAKECAGLCVNNDVKLILNRDERCVSDLNVAGLHLTSERLLKARKRPLESKYLVGASCHNLEEIQHANKLGVDYIFIGPVLEKPQSEKSTILDWDGFTKLVNSCQVPAYAIGGVGLNHLDKSILFGGQGIASIRALWKL